MRKSFREYVLLTLSTLLLSAGVYFFKFPNHFTTGGVSGLSILVGNVLTFASPATLMLVINYSLLAVGLFVLGKGFTLRTVYCSALYTLIIYVLERIFPMSAPLTDQPVLELAFGILLPAVASAIMFNLNASSGGTDVVAMILKKYTHVNLGMGLLISDALIALSSALVFDVKTCLFSVAGLLLKAFVVDGVIESINLCKYFTIVTSKPDEVCDYIIREMKRSATRVKAEGAYTREAKELVLVACRRGEAVALQSRVRAIDEHAFLFIANTSEIIGKGFRGV